MAKCSIQWFDDPKAYESAFIGAATEIIPLTNGPMRFRSTRIEFDRIWVARASESIPRLRRSTQMASRAFFRILMTDSHSPLVDGIRLPAKGMLVHPPQHSYFERTDLPSSFAVFSIPRGDAGTVLPALAGFDLHAVDKPLVLTPSSRDLDHLRSVVVETSAIAQFNPRALDSPAIARGLEMQFLEAAARCLGSASVEITRPIGRAHLMNRLSELLDAAGDQAVYVPDICLALDVPERTLRAYFKAHLGISPHALLMRRRLHLARAALRVAVRSKSVTGVATRYGFWHLGRFAHDYRALFGESPSDTLRRT